MGIKITASRNIGSACVAAPKMIQYSLHIVVLHLRMYEPVSVGAGAGFYLINSISYKVHILLISASKIVISVGADILLQLGFEWYLAPEPLTQTISSLGGVGVGSGTGVSVGMIVGIGVAVGFGVAVGVRASNASCFSFSLRAFCSSFEITVTSCKSLLIFLLAINCILAVPVKGKRRYSIIVF